MVGGGTWNYCILYPIAVIIYITGQQNKFSSLFIEASEWSRGVTCFSAALGLPFLPSFESS